MKGKIISDWNKVNLNDREGQKKFIGAFQHFLACPDKTKELKAAFQAFATKGDFPAEILQVLEKYHATPDFDLGYEMIFDIRDFTTSHASGFELLDVSSGLTFAKVEVGGKAKVFKFSGAKSTVSFDRYGGALGWDRTLFDDMQYWNLEDNAIAFRNKAYAKRAQSYYDLIEALPGSVDVAWQTTNIGATVDGYTAERDANTIEKACETILVALKDKGYGVNANSEFKILAPIQLRGRINRALTRLNQSFAGSSRQITYNVMPIFTLMLSSSTQYYVCVPKIKAKGGYRMDLTLFGDFDILSYADLVAGWMRYGGAIGDTDQFARCAIS